MKNKNLKVGTSVVDISPAIGVELCGFAARSGGNLGLLDNLYAKTIAIDDGANRAAILSCDLLGLDFEIINSVKNEAGKQIEMDPNSIMIACSHTHSGPVTLHNNGIGLMNNDYIKYLKEKLLESITKAFINLKPADAYYYHGTCDIGINRRGKIEEGSIEPSADPNGYVDKQVLVIAFYQPGNDEPFSILFNFGCHPVVLSPKNNLVSADYPGVACSFIEKSFNNNLTAIFTNGGAGNINPKLRGSLNSLKENGEKLGKAVLETIKTKGKKLNPSLSSNFIEVVLPYSNAKLKEELLTTLAEYNELLKKTEPGSVEEKLCSANINWANKYFKETTDGKVPDYLQINLHCLRIGDICLIGIPAEVFAETSAWIKEHSTCDVMVLGYTDGNIGYLPTREEILKGGYEVLEAHKYYDRSAHFSGQAEENIRHASIKLISELNKKFQTTF